jgi:CzcA family heavy metal efflux pump
MLRWIVASSLKFRLIVLPLVAALMVVGIMQLREAPVDVLPEFTAPVVEVQTESLGLSAPEVEQLITVPMEQDLLNGVMGVETIRSHSVPGLSDITMIFERGTSLLHARQLVQERLTQAHALPNVGKPPQIIQPMSSTSRVMMIGLSTKKLSPIELSVLARWTVKPRLMGLPGVANVAIWGYRDRRLQVQIDPKRLRQHGVSLNQVLTTTGNAQIVSSLTFVEASTPGTGGFIDGPNQRLGIRHILPFGKPNNLAQIPIEGTHRALRLGDVASVTEDHQPLIGDAVVGDQPGLLLVVQKLPGANTLKVTNEVQNALDELKPGLAGVSIDSHIFRPASAIENAMHNLTLIAIIAATLLVLALVAFLRDWRTVLISVVAIPVSLVIAVLVLRLTGASLNALVLAGLVIALGAVVDDAVGGSQRIGALMRERRAAGTQTPATQAVLGAVLEMRSALGYATLILLLAMLPVFFQDAITGAFVHPLALSYVLAVLASMLVALTVTPVLGVLLFAKPPRRDSEPGIASRLARGWETMLSRAVRTPRPALLAFGAVALAGLAAIPFLGQSLKPSFKDRDLLVQWNATPSMSLPEMKRVTTRATRELQAVPGVREVSAHLGRAETGDQAIGTGSGEMWLSIDRKADYDTALRSIRDVVSGYPGVRGRVLSYETDRTQGVLTPSRDEVLVRLYGEDYGVLRTQADKVRAAMAGVKGVRDPRIIAPVVQPTLQIEAKIAAARKYGLKPGDVRRAAGTLVNGLEVGSFFEGQKVFQVAVRGVGATRGSVTAIRDLLLDTPGGGHVRLGDVASVKITPTPVDIAHYGVERYMDVTAPVRGRDLGSVRADVRQRLERLRFPLEYNAQVVTPTEDEQAPAGRFVSLAIAAAIGIFLLLQAAFGSWRLAALVFATAPMALVGGLLVVLAGGGELSLGAAFGLLTVGGIAVRNAILLFSRLQRLRRSEGEPFGPQLVLRGVRERFAPTVMTTVALALALAPFAIAGDIAGNEISHSTATVALGGLVTSTLLTLFVLPGLYLHFGPGVPARIRLGTRRSSASAAPQVDLNI